MTSIPERIALCVQALKAQKGDDLERYTLKFGKPDDTATMAKQLWWDQPSFWNPAMTPREEYDRLVQCGQAYDEAIAWVLAQPPF